MPAMLEILKCRMPPFMLCMNGVRPCICMNDMSLHLQALIYCRRYADASRAAKSLRPGPDRQSLHAEVIRTS